MKAKTKFSLKDQLFNPQKVDYLIGLFLAADSSFPAQEFRDEVLDAFPDLELKERITHIARCLHRVLPDDYVDTLGVILRSLPPRLDPTLTDDDFGDFIIAPLHSFVALYGCSAEHLDRSLQALREITMRFSAEDSIRYFINAFPEETLAFLEDCAQDANYHVRRLASEGTRPKLPWAQKLTIDHRRPLPLLEELFADPTRYVTRSVANHLNDLAKIEPPLVCETLQRWKASGRQSAKEMDFILRHSLRTLVKKGDPEALGLLGYGDTPKVTVSELQAQSTQVVIGESLQFSFELTAQKAQKLMVDYVMHFANPKGTASQKVFKLKKLDLAAGERMRLEKKHRLQPMTTRSLYAGEHRITLQINGQPFDSLTFQLVEPMD